MAREFNGTNQIYYSTTTPVTAAPLTLACWFYANDVTSSRALLGVLNASVNNEYWLLFAAGASVGDPVIFRANTSAGAADASTTAGYTAGAWHHACGVGVSATDRTVYLNGANAGTSATSRTPSSVSRTSLAARDHTTTDLYFDGLLAEVGIWSAALGAADVAALAKGMSPLLVRPDALAGYWPLRGKLSPEPDRLSGNEYALFNTPTAGAHARVFMPAPVQVAFMYRGIAAGVQTTDVRLLLVLGVGL